MVGSPDLLKSEDGEILWASVYWFRHQWFRAHTARRQAALVRIALDVLRLVRVRARAKYDLTTADGRLALGREMVTGELSVERVVAQYGFSRAHAYRLKALAADAMERQASERERQRYGGTLNERCLIAAMPGSSYSVAAEFENVSPEAVQRWRRVLGSELAEAA